MDKSTSLISIIVPMHNAEKHVFNCINTIISQTYKYYEIIIVNDGSTDKTELLCLELAKMYSQIHYYYQENLGAGAARNRGMKLCQGDYLAFVDVDDYLHPTYLEELILLIKDFDVKISCCSYIKGVSEGTDAFFKNIPEGTNIRLDQEQALSSLFYRKEIMGYPWIKLIDINLVKDLEFPVSLRLGENFVFVYELLKKVEYIAYTSKQLYYYAQNLNGITHTLTPVDMKLIWEKISRDMLVEMVQAGRIPIVNAVTSKLFILAYDFLVRLRNNKCEKEFIQELINFIYNNRLNIVKDVNCKKSNRAMGFLSCINIRLVIITGYVFTKLNLNLKKAL